MSAPMGGPPMPPPDMSNVDPGLQPLLITLLYLFPGLALSVLIVRFWRKHKDNLLGIDDVLIALAWVFSIANSVITHLFSKAMYTGYRPADVPYYAIDFQYAFKLQYALSVEYNPCICLVKASFLMSLYKLRSFNPWIKRSIIFLQVVNAVYMVLTTITAAVPCVPIAKSWNKALPGGCYDPTKYVIGNVSIVIITDVLVLFIPTWIIWDLQMPLKRKIVTISFLSLGLIVVAIGIARLIWLVDAFKGNVDNYSVSSSYTAIESSVAIIGSSGPTIKYLLSYCIPWLRTSFERSTVNKNSGNGYSDAYGSQSAHNSKRGRSHLNTHQSGYNDLDSIAAKEEEIEMKNDWRWQQGAVGRDDDAKSDEQIITSSDNGGIVKSVGWTVHTREDAKTAMALSENARQCRPAASPAHIV